MACDDGCMGGCVRGRRTTPVANSVIMPTNKPNMTHRPLLISLLLVHPSVLRGAVVSGARRGRGRARRGGQRTSSR